MAKIHIIYFDINTGSYPGVNHGLASLSACVKSEGHEMSLHHLTKSCDEKIVVDRAVEANADVIGFSFTTNQRRYVAPYSEAIAKSINRIQIAGGVHPTIAPLDALSVGKIQGVCIGEGEYSLCNLLTALDSGQDHKCLPGFWWRSTDGGIIQNSVPSLNPDIDSMPLYDYTGFSTDRMARDSSGWISLMLARGCPYNCYYCCNHVLRSVYPEKKNYVRIPSVKRAIEIIKNGLKQYDEVRGINFSDDLLIFNKKWFREFSKEYKQNIGLPYTCNGRIEHFSDEVIEGLRSSGCKTVYIGVESGNEWVRKNLLGRQHSDEDIVSCFSRLSDNGISTFAYNIVGFPFETSNQMEQTLTLNKRIKPGKGVVFYFYPYPATRLHEVCRDFNLFDEKCEKLSGYLEGPAIKMTHCSEKDCISLYNKFRLYLLSLNLANTLRMPKMAGIISLIFSVYPSFWVKRITSDSSMKSFARKLIYRFQFR